MVGAEMIANSVIDAFVLALSALGIVHAYRFYWIEADILDIRFRFFEIRDKLYGLARTGMIDPDGIAYIELQRLLNSFIPVCQEISFVTLSNAFRREVSHESRERHKSVAAACEKHPELKELYFETLSLVLSTVRLTGRSVRLVLFAVRLILRVDSDSQLRAIPEGVEVTRVRRAALGRGSKLTHAV
jgi:hypothetical protein